MYNLSIPQLVKWGENLSILWRGGAKKIINPNVSEGTQIGDFSRDLPHPGISLENITGVLLREGGIRGGSGGFLINSRHDAAKKLFILPLPQLDRDAYAIHNMRIHVNR